MVTVYRRLLSAGLMSCLIVASTDAALFSVGGHSPDHSEFSTEALSARGDVFLHPGIFSRSGTRMVHSASGFSRRRFIQGAGAAGLLRLGAAGVLIDSIFFASQARAVGFKAGIGAIYDQPIIFKPYDEAKAAADPDFQKAVAAMDAFLDVYRRTAIVGKRLSSASPEIQAFEQSRYTFAAQLMAIPSFRLRITEHLALLKMPFAVDDATRINQILYAGFPAYMADHGVLVEIGFPRIEHTERFQPNEEQIPVLERWSLYRVAAVNRRALTLWNQPVAADELTISSPLFFRNRAMRFPDAMADYAGQTIYKNIVLYEDGISLSIATGKLNDSNPDPKLLMLLKVEWEEAYQRSTTFRENPFQFSRYRMMLEQMVHPMTDAARSDYEHLQTRYHERQHLLNQRRGLYRETGHVAMSWSEYDRTSNTVFVLDESSALIAQARHAAPENRRRELQYFISMLLNEKNERTTRLWYYNILDLLLTHLSAHLAEYPELKIDQSSALPVRGQLAGQLYRLTPESLGRAWDAVHAYREAHPYEAKMPAIVDPQALMKGAMPATPVHRLAVPAASAIVFQRAA